MYDYDNPFRRRNPFRSRTSQKLRDILVITAVTLVVGGGIFGLTWMALDSGYGACLVVRCVKIIK